MSLPPDYIPVGRSEFDEFSTSALEGAIRGVPVKDRRRVSDLRMLVSQKTYDAYVEAIATRMGTQADTFMLTAPSNLTYSGVPVIIEEEIPDGMIEVYGPPPDEPSHATAVILGG